MQFGALAKKSHAEEASKPLGQSKNIGEKFRIAWIKKRRGPVKQAPPEGGLNA